MGENKQHQQYILGMGQLQGLPGPLVGSWVYFPHHREQACHVDNPKILVCNYGYTLKSFGEIKMWVPESFLRESD